MTNRLMIFGAITVTLLLGAWGVYGLTEQSDDSLKREFRGVWIATVKNIDWPTKPGLSAHNQKYEFKKILDLQSSIGINAVIVQVRPSADAFYLSDKEPWSRYLTGTSGLDPDPYYDPLTFMIEESHNRSMEFHAWFNPYRAVVDLSEMPEDSTNLLYAHPEWFVTYGTRMYLDPGIPAVQAYCVEVIKDVTERYDIDAIHFDDYFYPYRVEGQEFPDSLSFAQFGGDYALVQKDDWRRDNVNTVIKMLHDTVKSVKPWVKFGISPFGVWRNKSQDPRGSDSAAGQTNYDDLFADVLLWMDEGWIDYVLPQLYLRMEHPRLSFRKVLPWWNDLEYDGHLYIGQGAFRIGDENLDSAWMDPSELPNQIRMARGMSNVDGATYFSAKSFFKNPLGFNDTLRTDLYRYKALVPRMKWIDDDAPIAPVELEVNNEDNSVFLHWSNSDSTVRSFVLYRFDGKSEADFNDPKNILEILPSYSMSFEDLSVQKKKTYTYAVTALDRLHNESEPSNLLTVKRKKK